MAILAGLGGLTFLLICVVGGARLLLLARRTGGLPEFTLGMGLFLLGGVATPLGAAARIPGISTPLASGMIFAQTALMVVGMGGFAQFTRQVFRPRETWAHAVAWAIPLVMLMGTGVAVLDERPFSTTVIENAPAYAVSMLAGFVALGWAGWESLRYAAVLRRRLRLGLADPVVFDRVRLWGIAMTLASVLIASTIGTALAGIDMLATVPGAAFVACLGFVAASAIYLAFLPPAAYTHWVRTRAVESA